jgi:host factor-I protein
LAARLVPRAAKRYPSLGVMQMSELPPKNQTEMLASVQADGSQVAIFLVNGIRLVGQIEAFDQYIVVLRSSAGTQTIYKHAISTVQVDTGRSGPSTNARPPREHHHDGDRNRTGLGTRKRGSYQS